MTKKKDVRFEYFNKKDDIHVLFEKKFSKDGNLLLQHLRINENSSHEFDYRLYKPKQMLSGDEILYHVSSMKLYKLIKRTGLIAQNGYSYVNHWMSFIPDDKNIEDNLQQGVFFTRYEPMCKIYDGYFYVSVRVADLDPDKILLDNGFNNEWSVFYNGNVPADKLIFHD